MCIRDRCNIIPTKVPYIPFKLYYIFQLAATYYKVKQGKKRDIQPKAVYDNVNIPDTSTTFVVYPSAYERGIHVTRYWDEPGLYTLLRLQVEAQGSFKHELKMLLYRFTAFLSRCSQ